MEELNAKLPTYEARDKDRLEFVEKCIRVCKYDGKQDPEDIKKWKKFPLSILHVVMSLRAENVQIVYCTGEADSEMATYVREHSTEVCGILTTDTDMVMMRKCSVFHCKFFDRDDTLGIRKATFNEKPDDIICDRITPTSLAHALEIGTEHLKILSIICGNDYTHVYRLHRVLELEYPFIKSAAKWIKENLHSSQNLLATPPFDHLCKESDFLDAIKHTYEAYGELESFEKMCGSIASAVVPNDKMLLVSKSS